MANMGVTLISQKIKRRLYKHLKTISVTSEKKLYVLGLRSASTLCLPDFLGIGAQKAGTTWLYENLCHHPELYLPEQKELHYFDWGFENSIKSYSKRFEPGRCRKKGEITPGYSIIPVERIRFIHNLTPDVRLIFLMRNPIDRAWSQALMNLVKLPKRKFEEVGETEFYAHFKAERSLRRGDYRTILNNWLSVFPREQLYVGFFEDITARPRELLKSIFTHLGISWDIDWSIFPYDKIIYEGVGVPLPERYKNFLREMYWREIEVLYECFGTPVSPWRCA